MGNTYCILCETFSMGMDWLIRTHGQSVTKLSTLNGTGTVILHNVERRFVIVPQDRALDRLRGVQLMGFDTVGYVGVSALHMATSRVR